MTSTRLHKHSGRLFGAAALGLASWLAFAPAADAADMAAPMTAAPAIAPPEWTVTVSPYLWATSLNGDVAVFGYKRHVDVPFRDTLKHLQFGFMGAVEVQRGNLGFYVNGQYADIESQEDFRRLDIGVGSRMTMLAAGAFYRIHETALGGSTVHGGPQVLALDPLVGVRWTRLTGSIRVAGIGLSESESWLDPYVGARATLDLGER